MTKVKIKPINIIFDGPPAAVSGRFVSGRFVEVEGVGEWRDIGDGMWALRITEVELLDDES